MTGAYKNCQSVPGGEVRGREGGEAETGVEGKVDVDAVQRWERRAFLSWSVRFMRKKKGNISIEHSGVSQNGNCF